MMDIKENVNECSNPEAEENMADLVDSIRMCMKTARSKEKFVNECSNPEAEENMADLVDSIRMYMKTARSKEE